MAHIGVVCPRCGTRYQVQPELRGKAMRCPNAMCRAVFEVREECSEPAQPLAPPGQPPAAPKASQLAGTVGEIVPMLSAETVTPAGPLEPSPSESVPDVVRLVSAETIAAPAPEPSVAGDAETPDWLRLP